MDASTYISKKVEEYCAKKLIVLFRLPTESFQAVNPMELAVRRPLKMAYLQEEISWKSEHPCQSPSTQSFNGVFLNAWAAISRRPELAQMGFWCAGLSPFDGCYNKDINTHPFYQKADQETSDVAVPTFSSGTADSSAGEVLCGIC